MEKRILLVEDDDSFRDVFTYALEEALALEQLAAVQRRQARRGQSPSSGFNARDRGGNKVADRRRTLQSLKRG